MARLTVSMPDDVLDAIQDEARRQHIPVSEVVRRAVLAQLGLGDAQTRRPVPFARLGAGSIPNAAERLDEYLDEHWMQHLREEMGRE